MQESIAWSASYANKTQPVTTNKIVNRDYRSVTNEEQNRSHDSGEVSRDKSSTTGTTVIDRRTCMKLVGVAAASLAGCAGKGDPTAGGSAAKFGYGGEPAVTTQLSAVDVSKVAGDTSIASSVSSLSIDSPLSTTLSPSSSDLFAFRPDSENVAVKFTPGSDTGAAAVGLFNPDGELLSQAYASSDVPVYLPESLSAGGTHYLQVMDVSRSGGDYSLTISTDSTTQSQSPYEGTVRTIPGRIQARTSTSVAKARRITTRLAEISTVPLTEILTLISDQQRTSQESTISATFRPESGSNTQPMSRRERTILESEWRQHSLMGDSNCLLEIGPSQGSLSLIRATGLVGDSHSRRHRSRVRAAIDASRRSTGFRCRIQLARIR